MGRIEEENRRRVRKGEIQKLIMETVKFAGVTSIGLVALPVVGAMYKLGIITNKRQEEIVRSSASKMVKKGLLKYNGKFYEVTLLGQSKLREWELRDYQFERPQKWDKKWRVIIFDIPEKKRRIRDQVRSLFVTAGLFCLQKSVWVYPYDCEDIINLLKTDFGIGKDLLYMIVDEIENDKHLRNNFDLL